MKKKIWILIMVAVIGWLILTGFLLYSYGYKPQIAKCRTEAFNQGVSRGVEIARNAILQEVVMKGSLQVTINGETKILKPIEEKKKKKWW